jgi:hypothetical protein
MIDNVRGTVVSIPSPALDRQIPESEGNSFYVIRLVAPTVTSDSSDTSDIVRVSASESNAIYHSKPETLARYQYHHGSVQKRK